MPFMRDKPKQNSTVKNKAVSKYRERKVNQRKQTG